MQSWKGAEMKSIKRLIYRIFDRYLRKKAIKNHRKMWRWLAKHPDKTKGDYFILHDPKADLERDCYLYEYAANNSTADEIFNLDICDHCPLDWDGNCCPGLYSLFSDWHFSRGNDVERAELAKQIAELPERKDR